MNIIGLGKYINVPLLSEWCTLSDIAYLDISLNKSDRNTLNALFVEFSVLFSSKLFDKHCWYSLSAANWATSKGLKPELSVLVTNKSLQKPYSNQVAECIHRLECTRLLSSSVKLSTLICHCSSLVDVAITHATGVDECVDQIVQNCPRVSSVTFNYCKDLSDDAIILLCRSCPKLVSIQLVGCDALTDKVALAITVHCRSLQSHPFRLLSRRQSLLRAFHSSRQWTSFCDIDYHDLSGKAFVYYRGSTLSVSDDKYFLDCITNNPSMLEDCPRLSYYSLQPFERRWKKFVKTIVPKMAYLTRIDMGFDDLDDYECADVSVVSSTWNQLEEIGCYGMLPEVLVAILQHCTSLQRMEIHMAEEMNAILQTLPPSLTSLSCLNCNNNCTNAVCIKNLLHLSLNVDDIDDSILEMIAVNNPKLNSIDLTWCRNITDCGIINLSDLCRELNTIRIVQCQDVTSLSLNSIALNCHRTLRSLTLYLFGDDVFPYLETLQFLLMSAKKLRKLDVKFAGERPVLKWQTDLSFEYVDTEIEFKVL